MHQQATRGPRHRDTEIATHVVLLPPDTTGLRVVVATMAALRKDLRALTETRRWHPATAAKAAALRARIASLDAALAAECAPGDDLMAIADAVQDAPRGIHAVGAP